jgi:RNA polymerase sigma-70 factor (ECF subfamily)
MSSVPPPLDHNTFPDVLLGARAGEAWAANALFHDMQPRLLRFLRSTEPRAADDLAGDVWLAVAKGIHEFEGGLNAFRGWMFVITRRRLADHRRTAGRRATDAVDPGDFDETPGTVDVADLVLNELSAQGAVDMVTAWLPADQAEVVLLRILGDLEVADVATVMGRTPNWVRVTQHRALRRLADLRVMPEPTETIYQS